MSEVAVPGAGRLVLRSALSSGVRGALRSRRTLGEGGRVVAEPGDRAVLPGGRGVVPLVLLAACSVVRVAEAGAEP